MFALVARHHLRCIPQLLAVRAFQSTALRWREPEADEAIDNPQITDSSTRLNATINRIVELSEEWEPIPDPWSRRPRRIPTKERDEEDRPISSRLWIGNLPPTTTEEDLRSLLEQFGPLKDIRIGYRVAATGTEAFYATAEFAKAEHAMAVMKNQRTGDRLPLGERLLRIRFSRRKREIGTSSDIAPPNDRLLIYDFDGSEADLRIALREKDVIKDVLKIFVTQRSVVLTFTSVENTTRALAALDGYTTVNGHIVRAMYARRQERRDMMRRARQDYPEEGWPEPKAPDIPH